LKVVHVWDTAGVSCIFSKYLRKIGVESCVVGKSTKDHDAFGFLRFYGELGVPSNDDAVYMREVWRQVDRADIVHVHSLPELVPKFHAAGKKVVLHYHGTELIWKPDLNNRSGADKILITTENLRQHCPSAELLPNPIDTDHFTPSAGDRNGGWLLFKIRYLIMDKILEHLGPGYNPTIHDRDANPVTYAEMPKFLCRFSGLIDMKYDIHYGHMVDVMSKAGLEALACGLSVLNSKHQIIKGLPDVNKPELAAARLREIYLDLLS
jgi:hypothetical protein